MEREHFGTFLRERREARGLSLTDLSRATKIKECLLVELEEGNVKGLPAPVFVRGFISAYARAVGADGDAEEAIRRFRAAARAFEHTPPSLMSARPEKPLVAPAPDEDLPDRRRLSVVMVVLLILVVATLTLSLLLGHGGQPGHGLS